MLTRAGFAPGDALHIYRAYTGFINGHILNELKSLFPLVRGGHELQAPFVVCQKQPRCGGFDK